jgi:hypothetical protein
MRGLGMGGRARRFLERLVPGMWKSIFPCPMFTCDHRSSNTASFLAPEQRHLIRNFSLHAGNFPSNALNSAHEFPQA